MVNIQKAAVIGCGFVGSTIAYTLMQKGLFSEMVLLDANKAKAEGEAMDISEEEMKKLRKSAEELGAVLDQVNIEK